MTEVTEADRTAHAVFQERLNHAAAGTDCAHKAFPEVTENPVALGGQQSIMDAVVEAYDEIGASIMAGFVTPEEGTNRLAAYVDHAMVTAVALGMALGAAHALDAAGEPVPDGVPLDWTVEPITGDDGPEAA